MNTVIESLNAWGGSFVQFAWPMLLQSAVVVAVVLGLNWALRRHVRAVVRYALLLLMLVKLVLPPSFALPTGAGNWIGVDRSPLAQAPAEVSAAPEAVTPAEPIVPLPDLASVTLPTPSLQPPRAVLSWRAVLFLGWVAGMTVLLGLVVRRFRSVARLVGSAEDAPAGLQQVLESCRAKLAVRQPVVLRFSAFPSSPAVCGLLRPVILVPKALAESFSAEQLEAVLLHELGHIKRGDLWVSHLQTLLQILYWYNPVLWAGNAIIRRVREEAVDELVMVTMKSRAETYPGTLLAVAKLGFMRRLSGLGLVGIAESNRGLKERIQKLVSRPIPKKAKLGVLGVLIFALVAAVVLPLARREPEEPAYQGKPLHVWLKGFDAAQESAEYATAQSAVQQIGTNALPTLVRYLRRKDPPFHRQWINLKAKMHLLHGEVDYAVFWHRRAAQACGALGQAAEAAFPALTEAMNDPHAASDVGNGLSRMMPGSVPVLTNILATGNDTARCRAADNLTTAFSHPEVEPMARTALLQALHDSDHGVRGTAASAFQFWNVRLDVIVPALTSALSDRDPSVRGNAVTTLGNFGSAAKSAVPELLRLLRDTNSYVSGTVGDRAAEMLLKIDPGAAGKPIAIGYGQAAPTPLASVKEGVYFFENGYSTTVLELKDGNFRYWFRSDVRLKPREPTYPLSGRYTTNGGTLTLPHQESYQTNWTSMTYDAKPTLWRLSALKYWDERKKIEPYGVLFPTTRKPEEIWGGNNGKAPGTESRSPDVKGALQFIAQNYPTQVAQRIDNRTIGVIWESGAEKEFQVFRAKMKKDFGVDIVITAIE